ncbi:MAG: hypothetical protein DMF74_08240 [Acidobacteria bacterium]|nr:MAG: hypothetical protein DMF74_08240 [Acidobacteriota bacterium]
MGNQSEPCSKQEFIVAQWLRLGGKAIGRRELRRIQRALHEKFGEGGVESPAKIARVLADEGAELRHPEVIEFDVKWREEKIEKETSEFKGLERFRDAKPVRLHEAESLIKKLEQTRQSSGRNENKVNVQRLREIAIDVRQTAETLANDSTLTQRQRDEQAEIAQWLAVWLQTPNLFDDWLDLRRRSPDFRNKFSMEKSS